MNELPIDFRQLMGLIDVKNLEAFLLRVLSAIAIFLAIYALTWILQRIIFKRLSDKDDYTISIYKRATRTTIILVVIVLVLYSIGFNLSNLLTGGGLLAVALAFATKEIVENHVSGIMLRMERIIKPGDVLEIDDMLVIVKSIGFRATEVRTKREQDLLIPNVQLIKGRITSYTFKDSICTLDTHVGISYESDVIQAHEVLMDTCRQLDWISTKHEPLVRVSGFGSFTINFIVRVWMQNPWKLRQREGQLNEAIWRALKGANIQLGAGE